MMPKTLYARLALGLVLLLIAIGLVYGLISSSATRHHLQQVNQQLNRDLARNLVADRNLVAQGRVNDEALKGLFHQYMVINPSIEIYLLGPNGEILAYSADPGKVKRRHVDMAPIRAFLNGEDYPLLGDDPRAHDRRKVFSVTPIPSAKDPEGYLYVVLRGEQFDSAANMIRDSYLLRLSAWSVAASLGFGLLAGLLLFHLLTRRLRRLTTSMDGFRSGNFSSYQPYAEHPPAKPDEIDRLGITFDDMAGRISAQLGKLQQNDSLRRELVAHVSHDLRTPLASLQGYLESLQLKEAKISATERAEYIDIALRHSKRLTRLVSELFELAQLDARETQPQFEPLAAADLVMDVVQKNRLQAEQRGIHLNIGPMAELPLVSADIAMTERVLENLTHNAINHTPAGGDITLSLQQQQDFVIIQVQDSGSGIATGDLPHIFEPFYQANNRHRGNRPDRGAGLGLAISRRIVELHHSELQVSSQPGHGTCFSFSLPVWQRS